MNTSRLVSFALSAATLAAAAAGQLSGPIKLYSNPTWSNWTTVPCQVMPTPAINNEAADDFVVNGTIMRVLANGSGCLTCGTVNGVWVRFYAWNNGAVGALQHEQFVASTDPRLLLGNSSTSAIEVTLPIPFVASGHHFISVQASFNPGGTWGMWSADLNSPQGSAVKVRTNGGAWGPYNQIFGGVLNADIDFELWGIPNVIPPQPAVGPCGTWSNLAATWPQGTTRSLVRAMRVIGSGDAWLVGESDLNPNGNIETFSMAQHWDGARWNLVPTPSPAPAPGLTNCALFAVDGTSSSDAWAGGWQNMVVNGGWTGQQLLTMYWDGNQWTVVPAPLPTTNLGASVNGASVRSISASAPNDVWFAGNWVDLNLATSLTSHPGLLMRWNGSSFQRFTPPIVSGASGQAFASIKALAPTDVWAVGSATNGTNSPAVVFHWNGTSWTNMPPPNPYPGYFINYRQVTARSITDVWALGEASNMVPGQGGTFLSHWNGSAWSTVQGPAWSSTTGPLAQIHLDPTGDIFAIGTGVWRYHSGAWTQIEAFPTVSGLGLSSIDSSGPCELWVAGGQQLALQPMPYAARTNAPGLWSTRTRLSCTTLGAPALLTRVTPPLVNSVFTVAAADAQNFLNAPGGVAQAIWVIAAPWATAAGCGAAYPTGGVGGGAGELLIDPNALLVAMGPTTVSAAAPTATWSIPLPPVVALVGVEVSSQAAFLNAASPGQMVFTNALDIHLGL